MASGQKSAGKYGSARAVADLPAGKRYSFLWLRLRPSEAYVATRADEQDLVGESGREGGGAAARSEAQQSLSRGSDPSDGSPDKERYFR